MITTCINLSTLTISSLLIRITNPVKISMVILVISLTIFLLIAAEAGQAWFPILFALIFIGGILIIFMILSSILPNENSNNIKLILLLLVSSMAVTISIQKLQESGSAPSNMNSFFNSSTTFFLLISIILVYFFSVILILCNEEIPMRATSCRSNELIL